MSPKMSFCPGTSDVIMSIRLVDTFGLLNPLIEFCYGWGAREPLFPARLIIYHYSFHIHSANHQLLDSFIHSLIYFLLMKDLIFY